MYRLYNAFVEDINCVDEYRLRKLLDRKLDFSITNKIIQKKGTVDKEWIIDAINNPNMKVRDSNEKFLRRYLFLYNTIDECKNIMYKILKKLK